MSKPKVPVFFHEAQLDFKPKYEWARGEKIAHPETVARAESILKAVEREPSVFRRVEPDELPLARLRAQHAHSLMTLYDTAATRLGPDETFYPMVFPPQRDGKADPTSLHQAGAFCFDSGTPLCQTTLKAAAWSAACARNAAAALTARKSVPLSYALSRPPGHHAAREAFGGYCYFNNAAIAVGHLKRKGRVAIVDVDYHHGNGTQSIFYGTDKVLTVSVHGDPSDNFPYFAGYAAETGRGRGAGFNVNIPLEQGIDGAHYLAVLDEHVIPTVQRFAPDFLVLCAGFDTYVKDPVGRFSLTQDDYHPVGERFGRLGLPTLVVQEGGYYAPHLGRLVTTFLHGVRDGQKAPD